MFGSIRMRNVGFSLATALSLGFGVAQAFASPGAAARENAVRACNRGICMSNNGTLYCYRTS